MNLTNSSLTSQLEVGFAEDEKRREEKRKDSKTAGNRFYQVNVSNLSHLEGWNTFILGLIFASAWPGTPKSQKSSIFENRSNKLAQNFTSCISQYVLFKLNPGFPVKFLFFMRIFTFIFLHRNRHE